MTEDEEDFGKPTATIHRLPTNPWSIAGLHTLEDLTDRPAGETWRVGFPDWGSRVRISPGTLSVVVGLPGSGKTHLWAQIWNYVVTKYDLATLVASFECLPKPHYRRYIREIFGHCRETTMSDRQIAEADQLIAEHYRFLLHPEEAPTLDWFLEMAEVAVTREKVRVVQLDPWNRLESQRGPKETETDYIGRCLRTLTVFAKDMNVHVQIVVHPGKRDARRRDVAPDLEDATGSMHWWNMPDQGFVIHRSKLWNKDGSRNYDSTFFHRKARFEELGYPCQLELRFNPESRVFESLVSAEAP